MSGPIPGMVWGLNNPHSCRGGGLRCQSVPRIPVPTGAHVLRRYIVPSLPQGTEDRGGEGRQRLPYRGRDRPYPSTRERRERGRDTDRWPTPGQETHKREARPQAHRQGDWRSTHTTPQSPQPTPTHPVRALVHTTTGAGSQGSRPTALHHSPQPLQQRHQGLP